MMLMNVVQDDTMVVPGFEHHTFKCSECQDVEQRLVFTKQDRDGDTKPMPEQATALFLLLRHQFPVLASQHSPTR